MIGSEFLKDIYHESGEQVRNINGLRNTYRSLLGVGTAAFIAFLSQTKDKPLDSNIWLVLLAFAIVGLLMVLVTWKYINTSLHRQRSIVYTALDRRLRDSLNYKEREFEGSHGVIVSGIGSSSTVCICWRPFSI